MKNVKNSGASDKEMDCGYSKIKDTDELEMPESQKSWNDYYSDNDDGGFLHRTKWDR